MVRPHAILHDVVTNVSCRSDQYRIVVLGIVDAFVDAHNHGHIRAIAGIVEGCMLGRIRLMTALTLACVHAFQAKCVTTARLFAAEANHHQSPNVRTTT